MAKSDIFAPATTWRALFVLALLGSVLRAAPSMTTPAPLAQVGKPDAAESARILEQFRQSGIAGDYFLAFELRQLPRRGEERVFRGQWWGGRNARGAVERIVVVDSEGRERRLLVQHGAQAVVWRLAGNRAEQLPATALFEPLVPGVEIAPFDLQMPFLYWPDAVVERIVRTRGRPAYEFLFRPPAEFTAKHDQAGAVRSYFDAQYNAPVETELLSRGGAVLKTLSLVDLKKVGVQWMVKALDVRDETTRNKTRLLVTGAALNLALPSATFDPAALASAVAPPPAERIVSLAP